MISMKLLPVIICLVFFITTGCSNQQSEQPKGKSGQKTSDTPEEMIIKRTRKGEADTAKKSIKAYVKNNVNGVRIFISYHSPAVRDRIIWGGLVPYDKVWVTGAHTATSIEFEESFSINKNKIPAGKYAFFTIPGRDQWTMILNKNWDQHLADDYDEKDDVLRWTVIPETLSYVQERLMYDIDQTGERRCNIEMRWEKLMITIPIRIEE